ncbi:hypothetical protein MGMO_105c00660 [Methyloglobulus morosus KoM1]|uniref:Uncharacterized protein n=2 Tax=Methyloglobulus TaxID=1410680 RepID=V5BDN1_9GAMM|nr:hypothetical protein MGMO_105c00660 [Methyloglobulus morosus KoM1]
MLMPDPDNERRPLPPVEFLNSIENKNQRTRYAVLLERLEPLAKLIGTIYPAPDGLLDQCLMVDARASTIKHSPATPQPFGKFSIAKMGVMWAYAHELFHFLRRHTLVEKHFGNEVSTKHALEYDADLCSVASLYRYVQSQNPTCNPLLLKRVVLMNLYWTLRMMIDGTTVNDFGGSQTHPYVAARLTDAVGKLAMLNDTQTPDPNFENPTTHLHCGKLMNILMPLELAYVKASENSQSGGVEFSIVAEFAQANMELRFTHHRHKRWDEISPLIEKFAKLPRSMVDNEKTIALVGDNFSLPPYRN